MVRLGAPGVIGQLALLALLVQTNALGAAGLAVGVLCGVATNAAMVRALTRTGATVLGPANRVTLLRATLACGAAAVVTDSLVRATTAAAPVAVVTLASVALVLDAVDGWVARRTASASQFGARFDQEVDAFLILVLSIDAARSLGIWVLAIGAMRYAFGAAGWFLPWLRAPLPPRYWNKTVAAVQGVVLTVAIADVLPAPAATAAVVAALIMLAESFGHDTVRLARRHRRRNLVGQAEDMPVHEDEPLCSADAAEPKAIGHRRLRRLISGAITALTCSLVWFALLAPNRIDRLGPAAFARIPIEGLVLGGLALVLSERGRRVLGVVAGIGLGALTIVKFLDMGFYDVLNRPFNPVTDWGTLGPAVGVLGDSIGHGWARAAVVGALAVTAMLLVLLPLSAIRVMGVAARHRRAWARTLGVVGLVWLVCAGLGVQIDAGEPVASTSAAGLAYSEIHAVRATLQDQRRFTSQLAGRDPFGTLRGSDLLTGLRGKDVIIAVVESYGQVAVQGTPFSAQVDAVLDAGTRKLNAAGYGERSAFLTSPTFGGISWLAHSTLQSGLWIDSQQRYDQLAASNRFTLSQAFKRAGWRTVVDIPSSNPPWPEGQHLYRFDKMYGTANVGYAGPRFSYATMPDQYTLEQFYRRELEPAPRRPVMAEIDLVSSHTPWAPLPHMVPWSQVGDGSIFDPMPAQGQQPRTVWRHASDVQAAYGQSIRYSLTALISFLRTFHDKNLVMVVYGDHQPSTRVSGTDANHDVPITIIARDPRVLDRISSWGWQDGMLPDPHAAVWPMSSFRNRFLTAFGPQPATVVRH
jgi:phosphatidylglycerophosphate synthase